MFASSTQRKGMTLIGLLLANAIFAGFFLYIDSYSLNIWDYETDVGPASLVITGSEGVDYIEDIRSLSTVTRASYLEISTAQIVALPAGYNETSFEKSTISEGRTSVETLGPGGEDELNLTVRATLLDDEFVQLFPTIYNITDGHLPEGPREIALSWWVALRFQVVVGDAVIYEHGLNSYYTELELVGIYDQKEIDTRNAYYYRIADVIVPPNLMTGEGEESYTFLDIDRGQFSPFNPDSAVSALSAIEESIREVDPQYSTGEHSFFYIDDILAKGILRYSEWVDSTRTSQLIRAQGFSLFAVIWIGISVRFNLKKRKRSDNWLEARGASSRQIIGARLKEILSVSLVSILLALPIGFALSRLGFGTEYIQSGMAIQYVHQFFVSLDSIIFLVLLGLSTPLMMFGIIQGIKRAQQVVISGGSRLERVSSAIKILRWDATIVLVSLATLVGLWEIGSALAGTPMLLILLYAAPLALILGLSSFLVKGLAPLSRLLSRLSDRLSIEVGFRRIGRNATSAGATILVITLAISLAWNVSVMDASIPHTNLSHARFAIGGDAAFRLNKDRPGEWIDFFDNMASKTQVETLTQVAIFGLSLSAELQDKVEFVVIEPLEYAMVGYDSHGIPIEDSDLMRLLQELDTSSNGAVMTSDIASRLDLMEGDALRAFRQNGSSVDTMTFNIVGIANALPDSLIGPNGYTPPVPGSSSGSVGKGRIWITQEYAAGILNSEDSLMDIICVRLKSGADAEALVEELLDEGAQTVWNGYATATSIVKEIEHTESLRLGRSIDTFLLLSIVGAIPLAYVLYTVDLLEDDRKQGALMRALGVDGSTIRHAVIAEMMGVIAYSLLLLTIFFPIQANNSINITIISSEMALRAFPEAMIPEIPLAPLFILLVIGVASGLMVGFVSAMGLLNGDLNTAVNNTWADNLPFRRNQ